MSSPRFVYSFGYWRDTLTGERQPAHTYNRALFGFGFAGGPMHADDCKGCAWLEQHSDEIESELAGDISSASPNCNAGKHRDQCNASAETGPCFCKCHLESETRA